MTYAPLIAFSLLALCLGACSTTSVQHSSHSANAFSAWNEQTPVGRIVTEQPDAARIFDLIGIDYCCGGEMPLGEAAVAKKVNPRRLLDALAVVGGRAADGPTINWAEANVNELIDHIVDVYHAELRILLPRLDDIIATVVQVHQAQHPELAEVQRVFRGLRAEMEEHLALEEDHAFPAIRALAAGGTVGDVTQAIKVLYDDHDDAAVALSTLHTLTNGYEATPDACNLYRQMLAGLDRLERQTMAHIHLENNVLFHRVEAMLHH
ncbi:MAG TPA: iron-sulfur cluster repair di-iron protein [Phycisphaerales bacterium]|nr:iron-sulfur cluster repair di-iron protein [Phycisphaerales bacterium]HRQ75637.1 iron-sulfur cluster repair di-iron protein [Phycisphaerales bacterium]